MTMVDSMKEIEFYREKIKSQVDSINDTWLLNEIYKMISNVKGP